MKLLYLSNYFNHHQKPLADVLYQKLGDGNYFFVEAYDVPEFRKKLGYLEMSAPYVMKYSGNEVVINDMLLSFDVVIYGDAPLGLIKTRLNLGKLTFRDDECRYRSVSRFLKWPIYTYDSLFLNKGYLLCASAFAPIDYLLSGMNPNKCFKWGYFPVVKRYDSVSSLMKGKGNNTGKVKILWCGRLIPLKHPESLIFVADRLRHDGYSFEIDVIGTGKLENKLKRDISKKQLGEYIQFHGSMKPEEVRAYMEKSDIFLFTSDRNEGWGAVLNESMNSGCAVVAGSNIGSVPYLVNNGDSGLIYKDLDWNDLYAKVKFLMDNPQARKKMGEKAYFTMTETWNGNNAANNLIALCDALINNQRTPIETGPCSKAPLIMRKWRGLIKTI